MPKPKFQPPILSELRFPKPSRHFYLDVLPIARKELHREHWHLSSKHFLSHLPWLLTAPSFSETSRLQPSLILSSLLPSSSPPHASIFVGLSPVNYPFDMILMSLSLFIPIIITITLFQNFTISFLGYFTNFLSYLSDSPLPTLCIQWFSAHQSEITALMMLNVMYA